MPDGDTLLAFDLGTTRLKVAAFDFEGRLLAREATRNAEHAEGDRAWQSPDAWWDDACRLGRAVLGRPELASRTVAAIGVSGRGGGFVAVDAQGAVVAGSWSDSRHRTELATLLEWRKGGAHLANYAAALLAKYRWLWEHEPEAASSVARIMYAKDYLIFRMTGEVVTDPTSGPDRATYDVEAIRTLGIDPALLPEVRDPWERAGRLSAAAARALGVPEGTVVAVSGHDGICANLGAGAHLPRAYALTVGTHAVLRAVMDHHPKGAYRFYSMPPGRHIIGGNAVMAGRAADWFLDAFAEDDEAGRPALFEAMDARADAVPVGSRGVRFLPFLAGQVAPEARPGAAGAFARLGVAHRRDDLYRAVLEGGAFAMRAIFEQVRGWCGDPAVLRFTGSGALSAVWRQIIVDALRWPAELIDGAAEARGAAIHAAVAIGAYEDVDEAARAMVHVARRVEPDPERADRYDAIYEHWRAVSDAMRPLDGDGAGRGLL